MLAVMVATSSASSHLVKYFLSRAEIDRGCPSPIRQMELGKSLFFTCLIGWCIKFAFLWHASYLTTFFKQPFLIVG